jgi:peptidoglycan/xylan/chitin deacetylase (PgdA/CDA1 family)
MQPLVPQESRGITILAYHLVGAGTQSPVDLPIDVFRAQLHELKEHVHLLSLTDAVDRLEAGDESSRPAVVITFDDGFDNFRTHAWPILRHLELPCTLYVPTGFIEGLTRTPLTGAEGLPPISWDALRDLSSDPLLTIGSHSWAHADMRTLPADELRSDLRRSRAILEHRTGRTVDHFCYPQAKWSRRVEREVGATYRTAVIAGGRRNIAGRCHRHRLGRIPLRSDMPARLTPVVQSAVCLEEWMASCTRTLT